MRSDYDHLETKQTQAIWQNCVARGIRSKSVI